MNTASMPQGSGRFGAADIRRVRQRILADQPVSGDDLVIAQTLVRTYRLTGRLWFWVLVELFWAWTLIRAILNWHGGSPLRWISFVLAGLFLVTGPWLAWRAYRIRRWGERHLSTTV